MKINDLVKIKFKVGDRVVFSSRTPNRHYHGKTAIITEIIDQNTKYPYCMWRMEDPDLKVHHKESSSRLEYLDLKPYTKLEKILK